MSTVALVLGALALAGVVFLAFGYAASLKLIRELQDSVEDAALAQLPPQVDAFARDRYSFVLVTEEGCLACVERIADLLDHVQGDESRELDYIVLQAGAGGRPEGLLPAIEFVADSKLVSNLSVGAVPLGLVFDRSGTEVGRSVLGDSQSFERIVAWAAERHGRSLTTTHPAGRG
jgi:hypothetical protein